MASNLLWAHLLRKDATATQVPSQIPPIAPHDKTGTSMRMLLHDTQANLEKFSTRLDGLLQRVDDCRAQVVNANKLLDVERDKVLTEMLELANRCQTEMKTHVGTPAQASALDLVHAAQVSTERSMQTLEKRIDALQALLHTHVHAMQSIQDQQNTLLGAVLPLVPIVHGVPTQIDQIKATLSDMVTNAVSTMMHNVENVRLTLVAELAQGHECAESSTRIGSLSESTPGSRSKRSNASLIGPLPVSSPLDSHGQVGSRASLKRARVEAHHSENARLPRKLSRLEVPLANSGDPPPHLRTPRTPRQPLADLLLPPGTNTPRIQEHLTTRANSTSRGYMRPVESVSAAGDPWTVPTGMPRPLQPLEHVFSGLQDTTGTVVHDMPLVVDGSTEGLPGVAGPSNQDAMSKPIKIETLGSKLTGVIPLTSSPLSSPPSSVPHAIRTNEAGTNMAKRPRDDTSDASVVAVPSPLLDPFPSHPEASPPKSMSLRDRRAQMSRIGRTETRRFITLVPWSDEDD